MAEHASGSYGRTLRSVRQRSEGERHPAVPNDRPLLPNGVTRPRRSSPRLQSFDYTGQYAYAITINTVGGRAYFSEDRFLQFCVRTLLERAVVHEFEVLAYCFMANHVHLLVRGLAAASRLKPFMQQFKQITGYAFQHEHRTQLWHRSYHDRVLRKEADVHAVAKYIWANPVRAGLAENAEDYPFSGPAERLLGEAGRLSDEAALGGQSLSSVRTDSRAPRIQQA